MVKFWTKTCISSVQLFSEIKCRQNIFTEYRINIAQTKIKIQSRYLSDCIVSSANLYANIGNCNCSSPAQKKSSSFKIWFHFPRKRNRRRLIHLSKLWTLRKVFKIPPTTNFRSIQCIFTEARQIRLTSRLRIINNSDLEVLAPQIE